MLFGKYINRYYRKYWYLFLLGIFALVVVDYVQLYEPEFLGTIVSHLQECAKDGLSPDTGLIGSVCGKLLVIAVIMFGGRMLWRYTLFNASQRIEAELRREMFLKSERLSQNYYRDNKVGAIMSWFTTDLETIEEFTGFGMVQLVDSGFLGVLVLVKMFLLDWAMTLFALIPMLLIVVWGALVEKFMAKKWEERQGAYDRLFDFTQENFTGIRVIKAFVKETSEIHAFAKVAGKNRDANVSFVKVSILFDVIIELLISSIMVLILGFGSWYVYCYVSGNPAVLFGHEIVMDAGNLITFVGYFDLLVWPMIALGSLVSMFSRARTSLRRISSFLDAEEDIRNPENAYVLENVKGDIEFRSCSFAYSTKGNLPALSDVSLHIRPGETVGVVGRIGSGKSTLVTMLLRLYNLEHGMLFLDGHDIMDCDIDSVRGCIGYVPQDNFLFSSTVADNIAFSGSSSDEKIREAAEFADVASNIEGFRDGYATVTGERGVTLSGGQKQRISLARAYLKDAPIMILDDSVSAVDVKTEETILRNIREKRAGKTTIVIASRVSTVSNLDRILVLNEGKVEAFDTPANLMNISPTYQKMAYLQELEKEVEGGKN